MKIDADTKIKVVTDAAVYSDKAAHLVMEGKYAEALEMAETALIYDSQFALAHCNAGLACNCLNRHEEAVAYFLRALECDPTKQFIALNLSDSFMKLGRSEDALAPLHRADLTMPLPMIDANLGSAYAGVGDFAKAEHYYRKAIEGDVWLAKAHSNLAHCLLQQGRFKEAWEDYGWRFAADDADVRETHVRTWDGGPVGSLLVLGEAGVGDEILWLSILPDLQARGIKVWWEADQRLHPLLERSFNPHPLLEHFLPHVGLLGRVGEREVPEDCRVDAVIDAGDLGQYFRNSADDFTGAPYLNAGGAAPRLEPFDGLTVGISWHSTNSTFGPLKSLPLAGWEPILSLPGIRFIDLQHSEHGTDPRVVKVPGLDVKDDFLGVAQVMAECDLVLTISSTTAHLAGALGVPCWVMMPPGFGRFWYWGQGETTPWYRSVRLFQNRAGWPDVVERVRAALKLRASGPSIVLHR